MNNPLLRKIASSALAVLLLIYVGYQVYYSKNRNFQTETASYFTASESVQTSGIAVRKEALLQSKVSGVVDYALETGDKINKGGVVAYVYSSEKQAAAHRQTETIDGEIARLQSLQSPGNTLAASPDFLNEKINLGVSGILGEAAGGDFSGTEDSKENLLYLINERQVIAGKVTDFKARIAELQASKKEFAAQAGSVQGTVASPAAGYFILDTETPVASEYYDKVLQLSTKQVSALKAQKKSSAEGCLGKICADYNWYFVCTVSAENAAAFRQLGGNTFVSVNFPFISKTTVPAEVAAVNQDEKNGEAVVVLKCNYMDEELATIQNETAQIILQENSGIRVSRKAIHFAEVTQKTKDDSGQIHTVKKEIRVVYVLHGNEIRFAQVFPKYSTDSYVVCDPKPSKEDLLTSETVKLNDEVVVEGTDLYDGKVVQ